MVREDTVVGSKKPAIRPDMLGRVAWLGVGEERIVSAPRESITLELGGIQGDRHFGTSKKAGVREKTYHLKGEPIANLRQVSIVSVEECVAMASALGIESVRPSDLGANIMVSGIPSLTMLPPGTRLIFGDINTGATVFVYKRNKPCMCPAKAMQQSGGLSYDQVRDFEEVAKHQRGLVGFVGYHGEIKVGDAVHVILPSRELPVKLETEIEIWNQEGTSVAKVLSGDYSHTHWVTLLKSPRSVHDVSAALRFALLEGPLEGEDPSEYENRINALLAYSSEIKPERATYRFIAQVDITIRRKLDVISSGA